MRQKYNGGDRQKSSLSKAVYMEIKIYIEILSKGGPVIVQSCGTPILTQF
jgi:hypothetical protein